MALTVKLRAGRFAVRGSLDPTSASYTRQMREQMRVIEENLKQVIQAVQDQSPEIIESALRPTFDLSQEYVPVDKGDLKVSGFLESVSNPATGRASVQMGYGKGGKPPYTVFVHEMLEVPHKSPTKAKFLQSAIEEDFPNIEKRLQEGYSIP